MECRSCRAQVPEVAHFCHVCGQDLRTPDLARRKSFALRPNEPVTSFALVSTIMPRGVGGQPQTYRIALVISLVAALTAAIFGALPVAVLLAAFAIPVVYIVYVYDVNLWEDEPIVVTAMAFLLTAALAAGLLLGVRAVTPTTPSFSGTVAQLGAGFGVLPFLAAAVAVPVLGELVRQIGPLILASRPEFDDLMDGLTFGIISGVAFSTVHTLITHWPLLTGGMASELNPGLWASLIFLEGFVKPLIMGTATGIACAEYSGLGEGYDGFSGRWVRGVIEAIVANAAYAAGVYLLAVAIPDPALKVVLQLVWGLIILGVLIIRVRTVLHHGLMEAALESAARQGVGEQAGAGKDGGLDFCPACEMPLIPNSHFCTACGTSTRVAGHVRPTAIAAKGDDQ